MPLAIRAAVCALVSVMFASTLILAGCGGSYMFHGTAIEPPDPAPDFTLTDHYGQPFRLSEQRGKVQVIYFGFTSCPDICPATLADLAAARRQIGDDAERVQVLLITVDPERDTQTVLRDYVTRFDPSFIGLRGEAKTLAGVYRAYGVTVGAHDPTESTDHHEVAHSSYIYLIDAGGRWRALLSRDAPIADIASDMRYLARE